MLPKEWRSFYGSSIQPWWVVGGDRFYEAKIGKKEDKWNWKDDCDGLSFEGVF